ncbi:hypothetical protein GVAV_001053 [Gurleya vavrai]
MNKEKVEMYNELEKMRPLKEKLISDISTAEKKINRKIEEIEKLLFDLQSVRRDNKTVKIIGKNNEFVLEDSFYGRKVEILISKVNEEIVELENERINLNTKIMEQKTNLMELNDQNKHLDDRLLNIGKLYLEKKEIGAIEKRKNFDELNKIEGELMKLNLETNHALLLSEQRLEQANIKKDRLLANIKREKEETNNYLFNLEKVCEEKLGEIKKICD